MAGKDEVVAGMIALTSKYERIQAGEVGRATRDFVIFKNRTLTREEVLAHREDWEIKPDRNFSFVGTGRETAMDEKTGREIPF